LKSVNAWRAQIPYGQLHVLEGWIVGFNSDRVQYRLVGFTYRFSEPGSETYMKDLVAFGRPCKSRARP
jgi:hypothetical protein